MTATKCSTRTRCGFTGARREWFQVDVPDSTSLFLNISIKEHLILSRTSFPIFSSCNAHTNDPCSPAQQQHRMFRIFLVGGGFRGAQARCHGRIWPEPAHLQVSAGRRGE